MTLPSRSLVVFAVAVLVIGCSGTELVQPVVFQMAFRETSAKQYILCQPGDMYCMASYPSSRTFSGALTLIGDTASLTGDGSWAGIVTIDGNGAEQIKFVRPGPPLGCGGMALIVTAKADTMSGTWSEQFDCHGLSSGGTFVGHRQ